MSLKGKFLIAMPRMGDTRFEKTVVYVCAHSEKGAMGFVINRSLKTPTTDVFFRQLGVVREIEGNQSGNSYRDIQLHSGGPVEQGRGFVLHSPEFSGESTLAIEKHICLTATLEILQAIVTGEGPEEILLVLGYAGWASGQLEEEIMSNGWLVSPADSKILFSSKNATKYRQALDILGVNAELLSSSVGNA